MDRNRQRKQRRERSAAASADADLDAARRRVWPGQAVRVWMNLSMECEGWVTEEPARKAAGVMVAVMLAGETAPRWVAAGRVRVV